MSFSSLDQSFTTEKKKLMSTDNLHVYQKIHKPNIHNQQFQSNNMPNQQSNLKFAQNFPINQFNNVQLNNNINQYFHMNFQPQPQPQQQQSFPNMGMNMGMQFPQNYYYPPNYFSQNMPNMNMPGFPSSGSNTNPQYFNQNNLINFNSQVQSQDINVNSEFNYTSKSSKTIKKNKK